MVATTISVSKATRDRLARAKQEGDYANMDQLIDDLLAERRLRNLKEESERFRKRMKAKGLTPRDLIS